jgi:TM2 domain-containing membrane protein YozV
LTAGLFLIGWLVDFFLIPSMDREADGKYVPGELDYNLAWLLLYFVGFLGVHRFYMHKWGTGILWLCTFGLLGFGWSYDLCTLNAQISEYNQSRQRAVPVAAVA